MILTNSTVQVEREVLCSQSKPMSPSQEEDDKLLYTINMLASDLLGWMDKQTNARREQMDIENLKHEPFVLGKPVLKNLIHKDNHRSAPMTTRGNFTFAFNYPPQVEAAESKRSEILPSNHDRRGIEKQDGF